MRTFIDPDMWAGLDLLMIRIDARRAFIDCVLEARPACMLDWTCV